MPNPASSQAGAETLVMSLWKVNDETTCALMEDDYRNLLAGKGAPGRSVAGASGSREEFAPGIAIQA